VSVSLSGPAEQQTYKLLVCCCGQEISIAVGAQQQRRAAGECGQCHVVSVRSKLDTDFYFVLYFIDLHLNYCYYYD